MDMQISDRMMDRPGLGRIGRTSPQGQSDRREADIGRGAEGKLRITWQLYHRSRVV